MKRFALIIMTIATIFAQQVHAQYYSVNFDAKTVAAMVAAYGTGTVAEAYYDEQVQYTETLQGFGSGHCRNICQQVPGEEGTH